MRILAARLDSIGDVLLCGPALRAIALQAQSVAMLCGPQGAPAAEILPGVDEVITWNAPWISGTAVPATPTSVQILIDHVRRFDPDAAVIFTSFHQSPLPLALLLRLAGVERITGASVDHAGALLDTRLIPGEDFPENQPEALRALAIAAAAGFEPPEDTRLQVRLPDERASMAVQAAVQGEPYVVVHPGADAPARQWPAENYRTLIPELRRAGYRAMVTGSRGETALTASIAGAAGTDLGGHTSLSDLARLVAGAQAIVTGNTGPAHLAAAVGTPVVSLFAPVVPAIRWMPWRVPTVLLGDQNAPCRSSRARTCPIPGHPCLAAVTPAEVITALTQLVGAAVPVPQTEGAVG